MIRDTEHARDVQCHRHAQGKPGLAAAVRRYNRRCRSMGAHGHQITGPRHVRAGRKENT